MTDVLTEQEKTDLWELYQKADSAGKKIMLKAAHSFLNVQRQSEGKKKPSEKRRNGGKTAASYEGADITNSSV